MEATQIFTNLLSDIEKSGLNYYISKTPFSAHISLKTSFAKYFHQESHPANSQKREAQNNLVTEEKEKNLELLRLREKLTSLEETIVDQKAIIEGKWEAEKKIKSSYEEKIAEFRAELLKVKSERNKLNYAHKADETEISESKERIHTLLSENEDLKTELNTMNSLMKSRDSEIAASATEKTILNQTIANLEVEVTAKMANHEKDTKSLQNDFKCYLCDQTVQGHFKMKLHIREKHSSDFGNQTELVIEENEPVFLL